MSTTHLTCVYKATAVGAVPVSFVQSGFLLVPVDLFLPNKIGLLYENDVTATVGQVVTRTITLRPAPSTDATATAAFFPGQPGDLASLTLGAAGADYAAPPIVDLTDGNPRVPANAIAQMGVGRVIVIAGGSGYVTPVATFVGGQLAEDGVQAVAGAVTVAGGAITAVAIATPGGPYQVPPTIVITDAGGHTGDDAILSPSLKVTGLGMIRPGIGYTAVPVPAFIPFFKSCCPDTQPASQIAMLQSWMTQTFQQALGMPVRASTPVIT